MNDVLEWRRSINADAQGSHVSLVGDVGNPGIYSSIACTTGSCCIENVCAVMSLGDCVSDGGLYLGDGTNCGSTPCPAADTSQIRITEFMYQGTNGEFFELTNLGLSPVNLTGWTFADSCERPDRFSLSGLGSVGPGQSVIVTDAPAGPFSTAWGLAGVTVLTLASSELGRNDEIRIHNLSKALVDIIRYGDETFPGTVFTQNVSGWPRGDAIGNDQIGSWIRSSPNDAQSSETSSGGDVGNPGSFLLTNIPAASTWGLVVFSILILVSGTILSQKRRRCAAH